MHTQELAYAIARAVAAQGGRTYYVGGYVRDRLMGRDNKDIDIEVHGITPPQLEHILDTLGDRITVGESFGVYALKGYPLDIAMPRREHAVGRGHRDFAVSVNPHIGTEKAAARRDFTVNAMMLDVLTDTLVDHYGGQADLAAGILRHVSDDTFPEDPLRILRGAQFAARFGFTVAPPTVALCRTMDLRALPRERVEGECRKALLKAPRPSVFFTVLREMEQLGTWFAELAPLTNTATLDAAAAYRDRVCNPYGFMLAAMACDTPHAARLLTRITGEQKALTYALELITNRHRPHTFAADTAVADTNALLDSVSDPPALLFLAEADTPFWQERLSLYRDCMARPYVAGRDLVAAGVPADSRFADYLAYAHTLRLRGVNKADALQQTLAYVRQNGG